MSKDALRWPRAHASISLAELAPDEANLIRYWAVHGLGGLWFEGHHPVPRMQDLGLRLRFWLRPTLTDGGLQITIHGLEVVDQSGQRHLLYSPEYEQEQAG